MDMEKVVSHLQIINTWATVDLRSPKEPIWSYRTLEDVKRWTNDAIELLNEQQPKTGHWISVNDGDVVAIDNDGYPERACFCSECKKYLVASDEYAVYGKYCPFCGTKMV